MHLRLLIFTTRGSQCPYVEKFYNIILQYIIMVAIEEIVGSGCVEHTHTHNSGCAINAADRMYLKYYYP